MHKLSPMLRLSAVALVVSSLGCTMCSTEHMCDYAGVGGKWQRGNPTCGRVGSTLSDAGAYESGSAQQSGGTYGDSWGLMDGIPVSTEEGEAIEQDVVDSGMIGDDLTDGEAFDGETIQGDTVFEDASDSSSILIGR